MPLSERAMSVWHGWKRYLWPLLPLGLIVLLAWIGAGRTLNDPEAGPPKGPREGLGELVATARACQTFRAQYDGLARIDVRLDDLGGDASGPFTFALRAALDGSDLVTLTHDGADVDANAYHTFRFDPLPDSGGQRYAFCLSAPQADLDRAITAIGTLDDAYPEGEAVLRDMWGQAAGVQDLDFHLGYRLSPWRTLVLLAQRLAGHKPYLCGAPWFYAALAAAYLALLYALLVRL